MNKRIVAILIAVIGLLITVSIAWGSSVGLVSYWRFDEGSGSTAYDAVDGNNGVIHGAEYSSDTPLVPNNDRSLYFDGTDWVQVPVDTSLEPSAGTVSAWVKGGPQGAFKYILAKGAKGCWAASYAFYTGGSGGLHFYITDGVNKANKTPNAGSELWDNNWHQVVGTFDGSNVQLYIDGILISGLPTTIYIGYDLPTSNDLFIGAYKGDCNLHFTGLIDEVGVWNRALSAEEVKDLYGSQPINQPPVADPNGPYNGFEGSPITFDGTGSSDPDGDPLTYEWDFGDGNTGTGSTPSHTYDDNGTYNVCLTVTDSRGLTNTQCTTADIANVAPSVSIDNVSPTLLAVGESVTADGSFTDPGTVDTHTAEWDWGDSNTSAGTVSGLNVGPDSHTYTAPGIYTVNLTVTDDDSGMGMDVFEFIVVYDPDGGFVTGGGWIWSPAGAYVDDQNLEGKANFGFVSKYKKGAEVPTGNTEFQFKAGDLNFHSSNYDWLVVTGSDYAKFKGTGTINGAGEFKFMLWAGDGEPDTFRIKIWEEDELGVEIIIYNNVTDQVIGGGNIVVHTKKK